MRPTLTLPAWNAERTPVPITDASGSPVARVAHQSVCDPAFESLIAANPGTTIIAWSGTLDDPREDPFAADPAAWLPASMPALMARLTDLDAPLRTHRVRLLLRPHARHILSDAPRCGALLRATDRPTDSHIGLALDPAAMLEPSMVPTALDHIRRTLESLASRASIVILTGFASPDGNSPDAPIHPAPLGKTDRDRAIFDLASALISPDCPIAMLASHPA